MSGLISSPFTLFAERDVRDKGKDAITENLERMLLDATYSFEMLKRDVERISQGVAGLSTVATTGDYADLSGAPTLSTVATTGDYSDLIGAPVVFSGGVADSGSGINTTPVVLDTSGANASISIHGAKTGTALIVLGVGTGRWHTSICASATYSKSTGLFNLAYTYTEMFHVYSPSVADSPFINAAASGSGDFSTSTSSGSVSGIGSSSFGISYSISSGIITISVTGSGTCYASGTLSQIG